LSLQGNENGVNYVILFCIYREISMALTTSVLSSL
jgi:hypothetical protein